MKNVSFRGHASKIQLPDGCKLVINQKKDNDITGCCHEVIFKFFWHCCVSLVKFSFWYKFHVIIMTASEVMTISVYKGLTRNLEIWNTPVWVLRNIWRLWWVSDTRYGMNVSNKILLNTAKCQDYSFYHFWVIKEKPTGIGYYPPATWWMQKLHYCISFSIFLKMFSLECYKQRNSSWSR